MTGQQIQVDLLIVGAGPTGLYAAYYAGFRGLEVAVIDALPEAGGQIAALYPEKLIYDVAGFPAVRGQDLVDALFEQACRWQPHFLLARSAVTVAHGPAGVEIGTDTGDTVRAKALLITAGIGNFVPRELPTGSDYLGRGLRYFVPKLTELAGQDVVVVGGGDSAVDWALSLEPIARTVTLVHRRPAFRAHQRSVEQLLESSVRVLTSCEVVEVSGESAVEQVLVATRDQQSVLLPAQAVVAALGFIADLGPIEAWGLQLRRRHVLVDRSMRTNLERIYAAGDIADYDGKVKLISIGFGEAALAVNHIAHLIDPTISLAPGHSTDA